MKELITFPAPYFFSRLKMIYRGFSVKKKTNKTKTRTAKTKKPTKLLKRHKRHDGSRVANGFSGNRKE